MYTFVVIQMWQRLPRNRGFVHRFPKWLHKLIKEYHWPLSFVDELIEMQFLDLKAPHVRAIVHANNLEKTHFDLIFLAVGMGIPIAFQFLMTPLKMPFKLNS